LTHYPLRIWLNITEDRWIEPLSGGGAMANVQAAGQSAVPEAGERAFA
jgi:hypothetical protein